MKGVYIDTESAEEDDDDEENFIKNGYKKVFQKLQAYPEYLRPMREEREHREAQRGKNEINWKAIHERANMLTKVKERAETYFTHMVGHGQVKDAHKDNTKYKQTKKSM